MPGGFFWNAENGAPNGENAHSYYNSNQNQSSNLKPKSLLKSNSKGHFRNQNHIQTQINIEIQILILIYSHWKFGLFAQNESSNQSPYTFQTQFIIIIIF